MEVPAANNQGFQFYAAPASKLFLARLSTDAHRLEHSWKQARLACVSYSMHILYSTAA